MFQLTNQIILPDELRKALEDISCGAFVSFEGRVRNHNDGQDVVALEYEAHQALCETEANKILTEVKSKFDIEHCHCVHRVGKLAPGDLAVWVGVTASHRDAAYQASRYVIDQLKLRLPIWKKEFYKNGQSDWVNMKADAGRHVFDEQQYYAKQLNLEMIGSVGQEKLKQSKVLVVGAGGLGSSVLQSLAGAGVGTLGICEYDCLDISNLHRQHLYRFEDVGQSKCELARQRVLEQNPSINVKCFDEKLTIRNVEHIFADFDIVVDCTDNFKAKFLINDASVMLKKTLVQSSVYQSEGQLRVQIPGESVCTRCIWPDQPEEGCTGNCQESGVIGATPSVFGHLQALETIKVILGVESALRTHTLIFDLSTYALRLVKEEKNKQCPFCGLDSHIECFADIMDWHRINFTLSLMEMTKEQLEQFTLVDLREPYECLLTPLNKKEYVKLPTSQFDGTNFEFDKKKEYLLFCAQGVRSHSVTQYLQENGYDNVFSLSEGISELNHFLEKEYDKQA